MTRLPWTTTELQELRALSSLNAVQIGSKIGRTPAAVAMMAWRHGIKIAPMPGNARSDGSRRRARILRSRGVAVREIARRMGASRSAVSNWTREASQA